MEIKEKILDMQDIKKSKLSLLSLFIRKTAVITSVSESLVELIIKDQWSNANKQTRPDSVVSEVDFPNIGIFYMSKNKSNKKLINLDKIDKILLDSLLEEDTTDSKVNKVNELLDRNQTYRENIKLKMTKNQI